MRRLIGACLVLFLLAACGTQPTPTDIVEAPTSAPTAEAPAASATMQASGPTPTVAAPAATPTAEAPAATPTPAAEPVQQARQLPMEKGTLFAGSGLCATCHRDQVDRSGADVSNDLLWRSTMMANAARDPYWLGSVRGEVLIHPQYEAVIEDKCATCHMPMARFTAITQGDEARISAEGFGHPENVLHTLALDAVSCTLCHQISDVALGDEGSFSGHFVVDAQLPMGQRLAYGPYQSARGLSNLMQSSSGFIPVQSGHVEGAEMCSTCHTLYTPYVDDEGEIAGEFPEQTPYLEWLASVYGQGNVTCQRCHMPAADGAVQLSVTGGPPREPFYEHLFVGGNAYMLRLLGRFGDELEATASGEMFAAKEQATLEQLQGRTASLALQELSLSDSTLEVTVVVSNLTGHKFPTGFPSRRAWLHLTIADGKGNVVFESGAANPDGSITGENHDAREGDYEPHYSDIDSPEQVQVYESVMNDVNGEVTMVLLRGAGYVKDNRLLPLGFEPGVVDPDIAVYGAAAEDADFAGGGDQVRYHVDVGDADGPLTVQAELLYQTISYRWAQKLRGFDAEETERFLAYYGAEPNIPSAIARATVEVVP